MDARSLLRASNVELSAAWRSAVYIWGPEIKDWEPDTFRIELNRRGITPSNELMAKLLAAQTVVTTNRWLLDHEVFFAVALACDGVAPIPGMPQHPTPEQLVWAVNECRHLVPGLGDNLEDEGFDPDEVDAAICCVFIHDGWHMLPKELSFADDVMKRLTNVEVGDSPWEELLAFRDAACTQPIEGLVKSVRDVGETSATVQLSRLIDCRRYIEEREHIRAAQYGDAGR